MHKNQENVRRAKTLTAAILALVVGMTFYASNAPTAYATEVVTSESIVEEEPHDVVEGTQPENAKTEDDSAVTAVTTPPEAEENITEDTTAKKKTKKASETTASEKKKKAEEPKSEVSAETTAQTTAATEATTTAATTTAVVTTTQATFQTTATPATTAVQASESIEESESLVDNGEEAGTDIATATLAEEPEPEIIQLGDSKVYVSMDEYQQLANRVAAMEGKTIWYYIIGLGCGVAVILSIISLAVSLLALSRKELPDTFVTQYEKLHDLLALFYTTACALRKLRKEQDSTTDEDKQIDENLDMLISKLGKSLKRMNSDNK